MDLQCEICGSDLIENKAYKYNKKEPPFICTDEECDEENRIIN